MTDWVYKVMTDNLPTLPRERLKKLSENINPSIITNQKSNLRTPAPKKLIKGFPDFSSQKNMPRFSELPHQKEGWSNCKAAVLRVGRFSIGEWRKPPTQNHPNSSGIRCLQCFLIQRSRPNRIQFCWSGRSKLSRFFAGSYDFFYDSCRSQNRGII